jgi:hypothetical protein
MKRRAVQVWVDVDEGIADLVIRLNSIPGVRTRRSCQGVPHGTDGTFCHGIFHHGPYVVVKCADAETLQSLRGEFDVETGWVPPPNGGGSPLATNGRSIVASYVRSLGEE